MQTGQGYGSVEGHAFWDQWYQRYLQQELTVADLHFVGEQLFQDRHACSIYGYQPEQAYERGIRLVGRTALEYCIDVQALEIAADVQRYLQHHQMARPIAVVDLFAGGGNLLYHIANTLGADEGFGIDSDPVVASLTARNLGLIASPWQVQQGSWQDFDPSTLADTIQTAVVIVDPPWGTGHTSQGLDLRATNPPVADILTTLIPQLRHPTIWVIKTFEHTVAASLDPITAQLDHYQYDTLTNMAPGANVGYLLGITR